MGYFDDPKHKAQWEKELFALRKEKERIKAGLPPVEEQRAASKNLEKIAPENDFVDEEKLDFAEEKQREAVEETTFYRASEKEAKGSAKPRAERVHGDSEYRVKITFEELLREANMYEPPRLTQKPREMTRQKEVSHEL
ncbi:MAG: hypothetical protein ACI4JZ_04275 [Oscillospiraceae bacterium]